MNKALGVEAGDVSRDVPAVEDHLVGLLLLAHVALHQVGPGDQEQALSVGRQVLARFGVDDLGFDVRQCAADAAFAPVDVGRTRAGSVAR